MNSGKPIFAQLMDFVPSAYDFRCCVERCRGNYKVKSFSCWNQFLTLAFAQLTYRESLTDIEACLRAAPQKLYHMGIRSLISRNTLEQRIADIWAEILKLECLGVHDNFFDLGGHSLLATRVISRIRQEFHTDLPLRKLFENPTVADLAVQITEVQQKRAVAEQLTEVLGDLEVLSDEEAERQLSLEVSKLP